MNIPYSWLRELVDIPDTESAAAFADKMTDAGIKVEGIVASGEDITHVVVGQIKSLERHPDADKLWVTQADIGSEVLQIITGADNLKVGDYIPVALHGATLANGLRIKKSKMRGLESNGMLCSIGELGLTEEDFPGANDEGILVLPQAYPLGIDAKPILGLSETVLDFEILSNRPDTQAVMGIAREAAAVYGVPFGLPEINVQEKGEGSTEAMVSVEIENAALCPRYIARVVQDVKIAPSPRWLCKRLEAAGLRPVNNIVDITNYVMLEYGQPLHAFDISAVAQQNGKHGIIVRTAKAGEKITTLDGTERVLSDTALAGVSGCLREPLRQPEATSLLIADCEKPLAIAGIMGGENTKVHDNTTTILFESANFDAVSIRYTARQQGMRTDASARYEKGPDPNLAATSVNRAMELVEALNCGRVVPGIVDNYPCPRTERTIEFDPVHINRRLGTEINAANICDILERIGIKTKRIDENKYAATVPTFRGDIRGEVDLTEEVARFYGYNNIQSRYMQFVTPSPDAGMAPRRRRELALKQALVGLGYYEAVTYPFESPKAADKLLLPADDPLRHFFSLKNPLSEDMSVMRGLTVNGLLEGLSVNYAKRNESARLFEIAYAYIPKALPLTELPEEKPYLTLAAYGPDVDYFAVKGDVEDLLNAFAGGTLAFEPLALPYMHPGRTAGVVHKAHPRQRDGAALGYLGELHPQAAENYEIGARVYIAVLDLDALEQAAAARRVAFTPPPKFPSMMRDLAFTVPVAVTAAQAEATIREKGGKWLTEVKLFDVYQGEQIEAGHKSMAYSLKFVASDRTLTDDDAQKTVAAIRSHLQQKLNAQLR